MTLTIILLALYAGLLLAALAALAVTIGRELQRRARHRRVRRYLREVHNSAYREQPGGPRAA